MFLLCVCDTSYKNRASFDLGSLRDLVAQHRASAAAMADRIPGSVNVGLFIINLGDIRTVLAKKHIDVRSPWLVVRLWSAGGVLVLTLVVG